MDVMKVYTEKLRAALHMLHGAEFERGLQRGFEGSDTVSDEEHEIFMNGKDSQSVIAYRDGLLCGQNLNVYSLLTSGSPHPPERREIQGVSVQRSEAASPASTTFIGTADMGDDDIRERVPRLVERGELPSDTHVMSYQGVGTGKNHCRVCGLVIASGKPEIELDWGSGGSFANLPVLHPECYQVWLTTFGQGDPPVQ